MTRCRKCNITISDDTMVCPLCRCAVEKSSETGRLNEYPEVKIRQRKIQLISNLILVVVLISSAVLIGLNFALYEGSLWCMIPVAAMVYASLAFKMIFVSRKGYRAKVFVPMILVLPLLLIIDIETGFYGWSLDYILPAEILVANIIILMLMLTNFKNRYSYMIMQIIVTATSIIPLTLWIMGVIDAPLMTFIAAGASASMFLVTLVIGGHSAKRELKIRFHIR